MKCGAYTAMIVSVLKKLRVAYISACQANGNGLRNAHRDYKHDRLGEVLLTNLLKHIICPTTATKSIVTEIIA